MEELPVISKTYAIYKDVVELNDHLPKRWRYSLGMSIETTVLDLLKELLMAKNAPRTIKPTYLIKASALTELLRLKMRLALEMKLGQETKIFQTQSKILEIGRMLGGWLKATQSN
ncbi:MAG: four helix bundle protein [Candidatus Berkelbacteria bacterium]|nr:four helix bundle protein [Candidatus Berkelbacteria bacterium]MCR4307572.1 four helix bundle protein [Candidatus Berkelbacteria bacterium]